jgi:hypothetical protein
MKPKYQSVVLTEITAELVDTTQQPRKDDSVAVRVRYIDCIPYVSIKSDTVDLGLLDPGHGPFTWVLKHQGHVFLHRDAPMIVGSPNSQMLARYGAQESYPAWQYPQSTRFELHTTLIKLVELISVGELCECGSTRSCALGPHMRGPCNRPARLVYWSGWATPLALCAGCTPAGVRQIGR